MKKQLLLQYQRKLPVFIIIMGTYSLFFWSCGEKKSNTSALKPLEKRVSEQVFFNPKRPQDYKAALELLASPRPVSNAELSVLAGIAHVYWGEIYDISATLLSEMQLELYFKATDQHHGSKFPITRDYKEIKDQLTFLLGIDAFHIYDTKEAIKLLSSQEDGSGGLDLLKEHLAQWIKELKPLPVFESHTYLNLLDKESNRPLKSEIPYLYQYFEAERLYKDGHYAETLNYLGEHELYNQNLFPGHHSVSYYNSAVLKLAALSHYQLALAELEESLNREFISSDSTVYKFLAITYLGNLYDYYEDIISIKTLWLSEKEFIDKNLSGFVPLINKGKMPFSVDWIKFVHAVEKSTGKPANNLHVWNKSDRYLNTIIQFLVNPRKNVIDDTIIEFLKVLKKSPERMNQYPTIMSEFIRELNLSQYAKSHKKLVQDVTQLLVFDIHISQKSWQRNRPAFLTSMLGSLRWHGARLPHCIEFLIDIRKIDGQLGALHEITKLFAGPILVGTMNVVEEEK